ncbi:uncharacterized protein LOC113798171 isoform X2 [Dermatophagoides pteronyssinus]|uniref:uncharacterized protein LOC113798171 isoform X2 n=1 Tax=Dermatophagoides pteronyssinus TaxID=6956 RepID=UPI003F674E23
MFGSSNPSFNFGQQPTVTSAPTAFGATPSFASPQTSTAFGGSIFGGGQATNVTGTPQQSSLFGQPTSTPVATATGQPQQTAGIGFNFSSPTNTFGSGFNQPQQQQTSTSQSSSGFSFGSTTQPTAFNFTSPTQQQLQPSAAAQPTLSSILSPQANQPSLFGGQTTVNTSSSAPSSFLSGGLFGSKTTTAPATGGFSNFGTSFGSNLGTAVTSQPQQSSIFGQPTSTSSLNFGSTFGVPATSAVSGILGSNQSTTSIGGGGGIFGTAASNAVSTTSAPLSFGGTASFSLPSTIASTAASTTAAPLSFGGTTSFSLPSTAPSTTSTALPTSGFNFSTATTSANSAPAVSKPIQFPAFGVQASTQSTTTATTTSTPSFGSSTLIATTTAATTTNTTSTASTGGSVPSFNFGSLQTSNAPATTNNATAKTLFGSAATTTASTTTTATTISFGLNTSTTAATTSAPSATKQSTGFVITPLSTSTTTCSATVPATTTTITSTPITTAAVSSANVPTATASIAPNTQLTFGQLEDQINIWMNELTQFESDFHDQSQTINSWDSLLISNGQKLIDMDKMIEKLNVSHRGLDHQLDFIIAQQKELEQLLEQVEDNKLDLGANNVNAEREHTYSLIETVHNDLNAIGTDLKDFIKKLNETKSTNHDSNDPMIQILKILNSHMDVLQWMENQIKNIKVN